MRKSVQFFILATALFFGFAGFLAAQPISYTKAESAGIVCNGSEYLEEQNGLCVPKAPGGSKAGLFSAGSVNALIIRVIEILLLLSGVVAVLFIIIGGYWYMTSGGNDAQNKKGKQYITNALIGLLIIIFSYAIVRLLINWFG